MYSDIFLEAHFDDVALSCGGSMLALAAQGRRPLVVTVFAGTPGAATAVTEFAAGQHARWGGASDPIAQRVAEQRAAIERLGADWLALDFLDAIYRGDQYRSDDELFGTVKGGDDGLADQIGRRLTDLAIDRVVVDADATWYAPLAVGNHVDHQLVFAASGRLVRRRLYEDYPYSSKGATLAARLHALGPRPGPTFDISQHLAGKIEAIGHYRSQMPTLFGDQARMAQAVRAHFANGGRAVERYWVA